MKNKNSQQTPGNDNPVFENKNKAYGAYQLRKSYEKRLTAGLLSTVGLFVLALLGLMQIGENTIPPFIADREPARGNDQYDTTVVKLDDGDIIITSEGTNPQVKVVRHKVKNRIVDSTQTGSGEKKTTMGRFGGSRHGGGGNGLPGHGDGVAVLKKKPTLFKKKEKVFEIFYDKAATFPGGQTAYEQYVNAHIRRPEVGFTPSGKINLMLSVDELGNVVHVELVKGIGFGYDDAVIEVIKGMPKWNPGIIAGKPAAVKFGTTIVIQH